MEKYIPIILKYGLVSILYIMLFVLVLETLLPVKSFTTLVYLSIGSLAGWHAKSYIGKQDS